MYIHITAASCSRVLWSVINTKIDGHAESSISGLKRALLKRAVLKKALMKRAILWRALFFFSEGAVGEGEGGYNTQHGNEEAKYSYGDVYIRTVVLCSSVHIKWFSHNYEFRSHSWL